MNVHTHTFISCPTFAGDSFTLSNKIRDIERQTALRLSFCEMFS